MNSDQESNASVLDELRRLDEVVADLRAQSGVEASELRARVLELERRLEQLAGSPPPTDSTGRAQKPARAGRAAGKQKAQKATKAERAATKQARAARRDPDGQQQENDESDQPA